MSDVWIFLFGLGQGTVRPLHFKFLQPRGAIGSGDWLDRGRRPG